MPIRFPVVALLLCFLQPAFAQTGTKKIKLTDIWQDNTFRIKSVPGFNAMKDGIHFTRTDSDSGKQSIGIYDLKTGDKTGTLLSAADFGIPDSLGNIDEYLFSKDEQKLLLLFKSQNIYRRSVLHYVFVADLKLHTLKAIDNEKVLHATFSPDGNKVGFAKNNNLYYKDLASNKTTAVSTDGVRNKIINGNCDWVYEEEFGFSRAYSWSPDGKTIAYYHFDESLVPEYTMTIYDSLYPTPYKYKYPKAGERNSVVQIKLYDVATRKTIKADVGKETDQYIPRIIWTKDANKLCILRMNRRQNDLGFLLTDIRTGKTTEIYREINKYYINISDNIVFLPDGKTVLFTSERDGFSQLYSWNWETETLSKITNGNYDIDAIVGMDEAKHSVYFTAAVTSPMDRKLYIADWSKSGQVHTITTTDGTHSITPCEGNKYFLDKYTTLTTPPVYRLIDAEGNTVRVLEDNNALKEKMKEYRLGEIKMIKVKSSMIMKLNAWMITPPNFDSTKKYPVLMFQYSGPNSQQVADKFPVADYFWHQMLAQKGYIIVCADGRGTGFRGEGFRKCTYLQMGKYESDDQIAVAKYLGGLPYIDKARIGIWGWSYGGFISSTCILKGAGIFKMAVAVAPVTNWRYYDNIYTERYMRKPQENAGGYDDNAPEKMTEQLKGDFLLIHGTGDDNVHVQNSMTMINNLIKGNKTFDSEFYPNRSHGISGGNTRLHLYRRMTRFIEEHL